MKAEKKKKAPGRLVLVEWIDSCTPNRKWHDPSFAENYKAATCHSVGWLTRKDKDTVVLAASYAPDEIGDVSAIPASCVKRIRRLK